MTILGLDHVQVAAPPGCERDARAFYGDLLGLHEIEKPALLAPRGGCWFQAGMHGLHVGVAEPFVPAAKAHPALVAESESALDRLAERLERAGASVQWADPSELEGRRRFFVLDPWGNRLELTAPR